MNFFLAAADNPVSHVVPHPLHEHPLFKYEVGEGDNPTLFVYDGVYEFFITNHLLMSFVAGILVVLVFAYVAAYLYEGDAPLAERRAQALSLDRRLLRELLGASELRELLDAEVIAELETELSRLVDAARLYSSMELRNLGGEVLPMMTSFSATDASGWMMPSSSRRR